MSRPTDLYSEFGYYVHQVVVLVDKRGDAMFRRELGISLRQFTLLRLFDVGPEVPSQQLIAERLGIAKSAVSRQIDIARQRGWIQVEVSAQSRRQHTLTLTDVGKQLLTDAKALIAQSEQQGFGDLPRADVEATIRTLKALYGALTDPAQSTPTIGS
ncbi:MarR family winged helix-turn-helix transcriptional regulator [Nocardia sp. NBC_01009]|uniref:MarR family winged helix-turn-helix transcriptional regulator n=1 Tax=Nocardia sp. NBC_01009 TaxID=2975996 RepID=UPI003870812C|nr:MarR family winged helix-turn-helix transcriptional regulator [Nocardia sp. NBC_01009]